MITTRATISRDETREAYVYEGGSRLNIGHLRKFVEQADKLGLSDKTAVTYHAITSTSYSVTLRSTEKFPIEGPPATENL